jgi:YD repeat-containing protein
MIQETNAISGQTSLGYDAAGNVTTVTDPASSTTKYGYDGLSRLISVTQPLGQTVRYEWDARDRLSKKILARTVSGGSSEHPEIRYAYETWEPLRKRTLRVRERTTRAEDGDLHPEPRRRAALR